MTTGLVLRTHAGLERFTNARLRNVGKDYEGFYIKVDLIDQKGYPAQVYLYLDELDIEQVCENWPISVNLAKQKAREGK